jgi:hypothetical protein
MFTMPRALRMAFGQRAGATLASLVANLTFTTRPYRCSGGAWDEKSVGGDGANLIVDGIVTGLGRPVLA